MEGGFKGKLRNLIQKTKLGNVDNSNPSDKNPLAEFEDFLSSGLANCGQTLRTSSVSLTRGKVQSPLTDFEEEEVLRGVEECYFRDDFDSTSHELSKFPQDFDQVAVDVQRQRLLRQLKVVTKKAFGQILEKRPECAEEMKRVHALETELEDGLGSVQEARRGLNEARKQFTASSLGILAAYKRRQRTRALLHDLVIISTLQRTDERLQEFLKEGNYPGAIQLLLEAQTAAKTYKHFKAINQLSLKLQDTLELAEEQLDVALSKVCQSFNMLQYSRLQEAYGLLGKTQICMDQLQMHAASAVHNTAWNVVYGHAVLCQSDHTTDPEASEMSKKLYNDLCSHVSSSSLLPCLVDVCRALCSIMQSYKQIVEWHHNKDKGEEIDAKLEQEYVEKKLQNGFSRIWQDVQTKIRLLVLSNDVTDLSIDNFLKVMDTIYILIQVGSAYCSSTSETLQQSLKKQCWTYFKAYHQERLEDVRMHLDNEGWALCPVKQTFKILQLKEYRHVNKEKKSSLNSSPRKRSLNQTNTRNPFDDALEESCMDEDFLVNNNNDCDNIYQEEDMNSDDELPEELKRDFVAEDEEDEISVVTTSTEKSRVVVKQKAKKSPSKKVEEIPVLTNTSLMLLRLVGKYLHLMQILEPIAFDVFQAMTQLLDFYLVNVHNFFIKDLNDSHSVVLSPRYQALIHKISEQLITSCNQLVTSTPVSTPNKQQLDTSKKNCVQLAKLSVHVEELLPQAELLYGLSEKIVSVESVMYLVSQFRELRPLINSILSQVSLEEDMLEVDGYFRDSIDVMEDLRRPIYMTVCGRSVNAESTLMLMSKVSWDIREVKSQHSQYVDVLLREMQIFSIRLQEVGDHVFIPRAVMVILWELCVLASSVVFVEGFSNAKKCSNEGRALMQLDFRHFAMKLEKIAELKPIPHQDYVADYIKAFYIPEIELESWVKQHTEYTPKQLMALINCVAYSNNKTKQKLSQMVNDLSGRIRR